MKTNKSMKTAIAGALLITGALTCAAVHANPDVELPALQTQGDVTYMTGGVGDQEAAAMKRAQTHYPLSLEFVQHAKPRDQFKADIKVTMTDKSGNVVLDTTTDGPFLLANLPNGKYTVSAADESGKSVVKHVTIAAGKPEHVMLVWS